MKILLIGHRGYLGAGLLSYLERRHTVLGWDKEENLFALDATRLARENVEAVVNLSVAADRKSSTYQADSLTDEINVGGARHLARILKGSDIGWIQMSTREVFGSLYGPKDVAKTKAGERPKFLIDETQAHFPQNLYGKSKLIAELISESHPHSSVIRLTTCYTDAYQPTGNWVVQLLRTALQEGQVNLTRGGRQFRDPLHIDDLGALIELVLEKGAFGETFHAGGGAKNFITLREFVRLIDPKTKIKNLPGGDYGFAFDIRKAFRRVGWTPRILFREKVPLLVENFRRGLGLPAA